MITKEWVRDRIIEWEYEAGESFIDASGFNFNELQFMTFCFGKGYLDREKYNKWAKDYNNGKLEAHDANYFLYNDEGECGVPYAVVTSDDYDEEVAKLAYLILGEFIVSLDILVARFMNLIAEQN